MTPLVKLPVKIYRYDDKQAPSLDGNQNDMLNLLKACLVSGYGEQSALGWSMPFEDISAGVKVFSPQIDHDQSAFYHFSGDNGSSLKVSAYRSMTSLNEGQKAFHPEVRNLAYRSHQVSRKWLLIGCEAAVWLFIEGRYGSGVSLDRAGVYLYMGALSRGQKGFRNMAVKVSGGSYSGADSWGLVGNHSNTKRFGVWHEAKTQSALVAAESLLATGIDNLSDERFLSEVYLNNQSDIQKLAGAILPTKLLDEPNFTAHELDTALGKIPVIRAPIAGTKLSTMFIRTDYWEM